MRLSPATTRWRRQANRRAETLDPRLSCRSGLAARDVAFAVTSEHTFIHDEVARPPRRQPPLCAPKPISFDGHKLSHGLDVFLNAEFLSVVVLDEVVDDLIRLSLVKLSDSSTIIVVHPRQNILELLPAELPILVDVNCGGSAQHGS